ncbi:hypothetical protein EPN28_00170 [Patescibacteria group bacterium]|nr:MAG: hypothetical protein EPN28_00170 [Patescibacteria group bacterium]
MRPDDGEDYGETPVSRAARNLDDNKETSSIPDGGDPKTVGEALLQSIRTQIEQFNALGTDRTLYLGVNYKSVSGLGSK